LIGEFRYSEVMTTDVRVGLQTLTTAVQQGGRSLQDVVDESPLPVLVANDAGSYVMVNRAACSLTGYSPSELRTLSVWQLTPDVHEREAETLWRAFLQQSEQFGTYRLQRRDGHTVVSEYAAKTNVVRGLHVSVLSEPLESNR
jgi:PAS domain S-box-containing protein